MIITVRENPNFSSFVNVDELLQSKNGKKMFSVYKAIQNNINAYDPKSCASLKKLNENFFKKTKAVLKASSLLRKKWLIFPPIYFLVFLYKQLQFHEKKEQLTQIHENINRHLSQIEESQKLKQHYKLKEIEAIQSQRMADPKKELKRLMNDSRIKQSLDSISRKTKLDDNQKIAIGHTLEIREKLKKDYYLINHGQNLNLMFIELVSRILKKHFNANYYEHYRVLRHDVHLDKKSRTVEWFKKNLLSDHHFRRELICGDIFLEHVECYESAIKFFEGQKNIANRNNNFQFTILSEILKYYFPKKNTREKFLVELRVIMKKFPTNGGNLYSIAIPKNKFYQIGYLARPYGLPVKEGKYSTQHLELMQDGGEPGNDGIPTESNDTQPQVRLLTRELIPENDVYIFLSSTLSDEFIENIENKIDLLVQRAFTQFKL